MMAEFTKDAEGQYRSVSMLSVAAVAVGLFSGLSVVSFAFWFLPIVGTGISLFALAELNRPFSNKIGRVAAILGLALSIGFGAQAVSHSVVSLHYARKRAEASARAWIGAVRENRLSDAKSMSGQAALPMTNAPGEDAPVEKFAVMPAVAALMKCAPQGEIVVYDEGGSDGPPVTRMVRVEIACGTDSAIPKTELRIGLERRTEGAFDRWMIIGHELLTPVR